MQEKDRSVSLPPTAIWHKIMDVGGALTREFDDGVLTTPELAKVVHFQLCELARIYHQLKHLHSEKGGDD